jgi:hypothetical protein
MRAKCADILSVFVTQRRPVQKPAPSLARSLGLLEGYEYSQYDTNMYRYAPFLLPYHIKKYKAPREKALMRIHNAPSQTLVRLKSLWHYQ